MAKKAVLELLDSPKLISRKIFWQKILELSHCEVTKISSNLKLVYWFKSSSPKLDKSQNGNFICENNFDFAHFCLINLRKNIFDFMWVSWKKNLIFSFSNTGRSTSHEKTKTSLEKVKIVKLLGIKIKI